MAMPPGGGEPSERPRPGSRGDRLREAGGPILLGLRAVRAAAADAGAGRPADVAGADDVPQDASPRRATLLVQTIQTLMIASA